MNCKYINDNFYVTLFPFSSDLAGYKMHLLCDAVTRLILTARPSLGSSHTELWLVCVIMREAN